MFDRVQNQREGYRSREDRRRHQSSGNRQRGGDTKIEQGRQQQPAPGPGMPHALAVADDIDRRLARKDECDESKGPQLSNIETQDLLSGRDHADSKS